LSSTFNIVADIVARTSHVPRETIVPESNLLKDLGVDSLDLLDIGFAIDEAFGVRMPIEQWLHAVHMKSAAAADHFVLHELCARVDQLIVAAAA
jgi:acyl carrier protein